MKKILLPLLMVTSLWSAYNYASLTLTADRMIYNEEEGDASITIHSTEKRAYLVQSWLDDGDSTLKKILPFVVTPPLFRLAPQSDNVIRVVYLGNGLPADRESLFWLDVKGVPGLNDEETQAENRMVLAINNRIKFFYRPAGLKGESGEAVKNVHWARSGNILTVDNPSPYYLVLSKIVADKESVKVSVVDNNTVIPPFGKKSYKFKHSLTNGSNVEWDGINDFGVTSKTYSQHLE